jgi:hypothetical protein
LKKQDLRRLAIGFACAVAIHEVAAMLFPRMQAEDTKEPIVARVTIARIVRTPRPSPTATPTPASLTTRIPSLVAAGKHAHIEPIKHVGSKRPTPPKAKMATPDVSIPTGGHGAGAQNGTDAGSTSTQNGNGSGTGNAGNGNGAAICGAVDFESSSDDVLNPESGYYERRDIVATVHYSDGTEMRIPLDYIWRWKNQADDPFRPGSDKPMLFQSPPVALRASEPAAVIYIMQHTKPGGGTKLDDCGNIPPPPTAAPTP